MSERAARRTRIGALLLALLGALSQAPWAEIAAFTRGLLEAPPAAPPGGS